MKSQAGIERPSHPSARKGWACFVLNAPHEVDVRISVPNGRHSVWSFGGYGESFLFSFRAVFARKFQTERYGIHEIEK